MSRFFLYLPGHIARTALAAAFGVVLIGSTAHAQDVPAKPDQKQSDTNLTEAQKHQKEMDKGKDHAAARDAAGPSKKPVQAPSETEAQRHQKEMDKGKDHAAARDAAGAAKQPAQASPEVINKEKSEKQK